MDMIFRFLFFCRHLIVVLGILLGISTPAFAQVEIDITQGNIQAIPIAVARFEAGSFEEQQFAQEVVQVIQADLAGSGLFDPLDPASFIDKGASVLAVPKFSDWRIIKAQALLVGKVERLPDRRRGSPQASSARRDRQPEWCIRGSRSLPRRGTGRRGCRSRPV